MIAKRFLGLFSDSLKDFSRNFWIIIAGLFLFGAFLGISEIGGKIAYSFQTSISNLVWTLAYIAIIFVIGGFVFAGMIGVAGKAVRGKRSGWKDFFISGKKFWFRNFLVLVLFLVLFDLMNGILFVFGEFMIYLSGWYAVSSEVFRALLFFISFAYLAGFFVFFSFTQFFIVLEDKKLWGGIKSSWKFVKENYLETLSMIVIFFVIFRLTSRIGGNLELLLIYGLVLPYLAFIWTRFVLAGARGAKRK